MTCLVGLNENQLRLLTWLRLGYWSAQAYCTIDAQSDRLDVAWTTSAVRAFGILQIYLPLVLK